MRPLLLLLLLTGCTTLQSADAWISESEPRSWAAHTLEMGAAVTASEVIADNPWYGYAAMMGGLAAWEIQEARLTNWNVPWWGTAMDLLAPAVVGFLLGRWLDGDGDDG